MTDRHTQRRAEIFRQRARVLTEAAAHVFRDESRRLHMLDLAKSYEHTANEMSPPSPRELLIETCGLPHPRWLATGGGELSLDGVAPHSLHGRNKGNQ
jgi:hypothetical protein